ncbi:hypothetical protein GYH30_017219 [Glycine max]|uniref:Uncharacterized protein n=1 Tax=Glycine max TaxID=3847 RepID=A0A2K7JRH4_SOYBN|nr:hypothetical protein GYH30_017219 [Glycine max]
MSLDSKYNFDELQWVIQIRRTLEEELDEDGEFPVSIFSLHLALNYHYWRPELYEMQRYKLAAAKRFQKQLQSLKLDNLVDQLTKLEQRVRACYHKFLDFNGETLVWMMAIDASFLLEFLEVCTIQDMLNLKFIGLFKEISPFKMMEEYPTIQVSKSAHLLDFLYHMIVPNILEGQDTIEVEFKQGEEEEEGNEESNADFSQVKQLYSELWKRLSKLNKGPVKLIILPWKTVSNLPGFKVLKQPLEYLFSQNGGESENSSSNSSLKNKPPSVEEITVPSVTELLNSGVRFLPTNGSILNITFDAKTCTFYLPTIGLDANTEVFLKNLVAYEASVASGPLVVTRYTELMNGIIDSDEDAKILREKGIILNHLKSDKEVANLWSGMSKLLRLSREPLLDKVIEDVNKYYNGRMKV